MFLGLLEHVAHARGTDADEHLDEIGTGDGEERHLGFARNGLGQQRLTGTGAAHHQHAARNASAEILELGRIAQEIDQFGNFFLGLVATCHIGKSHALLGIIQHARLALAERECAAALAALHLAHEEYPHADQQQHREPRYKDAHQEGLFFFRLGFDLHAVLEQVGNQPDVAGRIAGDALAVGGGRLQRTAFDGHLLDVP